nr:type VI secretion system tube protein Hcp [Ereboglobus luteus]
MAAKVIKHTINRKRRGRGSEIGQRAADASGEITISKQLDATSPKLHQICMECRNFASDKYIEGKVEVHICRQIPGADGGSAVREVYMGYILRKCLMTGISITANESDYMEESITLTFERVTSCVRRPKQAALNNVGWDYVAEDTDTPDELTPLTKT